MERGNTKHGARLDEEMAQEVRGIVQGDGSDSRGLEGGAPPGMTYEEVEERSRLGRFIPRSSLPGDRDTLILGAHGLDAPDDVLQQLAKLPPNETFLTVNEIWAALGHGVEDRRT